MKSPRSPLPRPLGRPPAGPAAWAPPAPPAAPTLPAPPARALPSLPSPALAVRLARAFPALALLLAAALLAAGCVQIADSAGPRPAPAQADLAAQAGAAYDRGDWATAVSLYRRWLGQNPHGPRREPVLALAGLASERAGARGEAAAFYQSLLTEFPSSGYAADLRARIPDLLLLDGRADEAIHQASALAVQAGPAVRAALRLSAGRAFYTSGRWAEAAAAFIEAMSGPPNVAEAARSGLEAALLAMDPATLYNVARQYGQNYPGPEAAWYLARREALSGDRAAFEERADYFRRYFPNHPWAPLLAALASDPASVRAPGQDWNPRPGEAAPALAVTTASASGGAAAGPTPSSERTGRVVLGALLPLTGDPSSKFAAEILAGLRLAVARLAPQAQVVALDTGGDPGRTVQLVHDASADPAMLALVGPLTSREALAAAQTAQSAAMPVIAVSQRLGLTAGRPLVFRLFLTPKHQAEAVARYAVKVQGHRRLAALHPSDAYGQTMAGFFRAEVERLGGVVTRTASYDGKSRDFAAAITSLTGGGSVRRASASYQAPVDFEALFIPDSPGNIGQIVPQLAYHDLTRMTYLGTPLWLTRELARDSGRYLAHSIIPDAFNSLSQRPEAIEFRELFLQANGREPDQFAAYGYDAGVAVAAALAGGAASRAELVRALSALGPFPGVTGPFSFDSDGDYSVEPMMLTVEGDSFVVLAEPSAFR